MSVAERIREAVGHALVAEMQRVNDELEAQAPIPDSASPPLEELQQILAALQERQPRRHAYLRTKP